jgi:hypothetical protein
MGKARGFVFHFDKLRAFGEFKCRFKNCAFEA